MKCALVLLVGMLVVAERVQATDYTADSCSRADVATKVALAVEGDTVILPDCPSGVSWTTHLAISKAISLRGASLCTLNGDGVPTSCPTKIIDDVPKSNGSIDCTGADTLITMESTTDQAVAWRWSHLQFTGSATDPIVCARGHFAIATRSHSLRIDHIYMQSLKTVGMFLHGDPQGVVDHVRFGDPGDSPRVAKFQLGHENYNGGVDYADKSWSEASTLGGAGALYIEDSESHDDLEQGVGFIDGDRGMRVVIRYSRFSFSGSHGTESAGRRRGARQFEIYNNTITSQPNGQGSAVYMRSGTGVVYNNTFRCGSGGCGVSPITNAVVYDNDRDRDTYSPWGSCDGNGAWDTNDGTTYHSGAHTGGSATDVLTDSGASFGTLNTGYSVRNTTAGWSSTIASTTGTTVTSQASIYGGAYAHTWANGDSYQIKKAYPCVDQVGRGSGDLLADATPTPSGWPNQVLAPVYAWNNTWTDDTTTTPFGSQSTHIQVNRDYYTNTAMPGYTPYTYPHPLQDVRGAGLRSSKGLGLF